MSRIGMVLIGDIRYDGRVRKEIETLVRAGHHVELVVSDFGKTASGGEDLGINIHYINMTLWSQPVMNFLEQLLFNLKAASTLKNLSVSHLHCHDLSALLAGVWTKKRLKAKLIFDAHELMPESMGGIKEKIWGQIEKRSINSCDHIIMPEKNRIAYFKRKYIGIPEPLLLENFPRRSELPTKAFDLFRTRYPIKKSQVIILYSGTVDSQRYIEELIESISLSSTHFVLVILGRTFKSYKETLQTKIKKLSLKDRAFLHEPVAHAKILEYMASCDIGIALYPNTNINNYFCASNKLYEYIALSKIVLTNNYPGLLESVERFKQGLCLPEVSAQSLEEAYRYVSTPFNITPGARKFFWEDYSTILTDFYD